MRVSVCQNRLLKIHLSAVEIFDYFGSYDDIRYDNPLARSVLGRLLCTAADGMVFLKDAKRLTIKVFPEEKGGCAIHYIASPKIKRYRRASEGFLLEFSSCENLLRFCERILSLGANPPCSVFRSDFRYRMIIDGVCSKETAAEYADCIFRSFSEKQKTREHWQRVCQNTPVKTICGL